MRERRADWEASWASTSPHNQMYGLTFNKRVKGADEYYQSTKDKKPLEGGVSGVKVLDDYTLEKLLILRN